MDEEDNFQSPQLDSPLIPGGNDAPPAYDYRINNPHNIIDEEDEKKNKGEDNINKLFVDILQTEDTTKLEQQQKNTLDESIWETINRDVDSVKAKLKTVLSAGQASTSEQATLKDWDMWGPLLFTLLMAMYHLFLCVFNQ